MEPGIRRKKHEACPFWRDRQAYRQTDTFVIGHATFALTDLFFTLIFDPYLGHVRVY